MLMGLRIFTRLARRACKPQLKVMRPENHKYIISGLEEYWSSCIILIHRELPPPHPEEIIVNGEEGAMMLTCSCPMDMSASI